MTLAAVPQCPLSLNEQFAPQPVCADVSIVIPTLGRDLLETCLAHIARGTRWPQTLVVVDQGRAPAVSAMIERLRQLSLDARYIPSTERGKSAGLNRGLAAVTTRFVAITDDDCFVAPDWLERLADRLRQEPGTIWTGRVEAAGDEHAFSTALSSVAQRQTRPRLRGQPFAGGNAGLALEVASRVGPFDEHPSLVCGAEDVDYGHRALRLGVPIAYDPAIVLYHYHWRDEAARVARYADYARGQGAFYGKHLRRGDGLVLLQALRDLARSPVRWARGALSGDRELARNGRESTLNLLPGIVAGLRRRDAAPR